MSAVKGYRHGLCLRLGAVNRRIKKLHRKLENSQALAAARGRPEPTRIAEIDLLITAAREEAATLKASIDKSYQREREAENAQF